MYKICPLGAPDLEAPTFYFGTPHISEANRARKLKFGSHLQVLWLRVIICPFWGDQQPLFFYFWTPPHLCLFWDPIISPKLIDLES